MTVVKIRDVDGLVVAAFPDLFSSGPWEEDSYTIRELNVGEEYDPIFPYNEVGGELVADPEPLWSAMRAQRDLLLLSTDKYMIVDYPISEEDRDGWIVYRQSLRDLPEVTLNPDPSFVEWPEPPE